MKKYRPKWASIGRSLLRSKISILCLFAPGLLLILLLLQSAFYPGLLSEKSFLNYDAWHYFSISTKGYEEYQQAFFPLFPFFWKLLSVNARGIVLVNALLYLGSFYFLAKSFSLNRREMLFYLCIPSSLFFFLPYSESCFYVGAVLLIVGVKTNRFILTLVALFLCSLARPAFTVLLPALILMEIMSEGKNIKVILADIGAYLLVALSGTLTVAWIQFCCTGKWFGFFAAQRLWGNYLQLPTFPLRTWGGDTIIRLDGTALLFGGMAAFILVACFLRIGPFGKLKLPREVVLSLAYLAGITLAVLLFRGGSLFSLNRFVFSVPFIVVALDYYLKLNIAFSVRQLSGALVCICMYWLLFGSFLHVTTALKFFALSCYILLFLLVKSENTTLGKWGFYVLTVINYVFLLIFFVRFLRTQDNNGWIG
ncbi:MAG: hypothetical protein K0R65_1812 [Crocinitomicaceae bacterium]|jgi:hypothetical protein|nr:hypothetical protein [Crocinitomicaceae bacterium]